MSNKQIKTLQTKKYYLWDDLESIYEVRAIVRSLNSVIVDKFYYDEHDQLECDVNILLNIDDFMAHIIAINKNVGKLSDRVLLHRLRQKGLRV